MRVPDPRFPLTFVLYSIQSASMNNFFRLIALILSLTVATAAFGQTETVQVDITKLSQQELLVYQQLKQKQQQGAGSLVNPDNIEKYAQIGKSFGTAFKECWSTVSADAEKFANSSAGKWAMVLITWKIMGDDAINLMEKSVSYAIGIPLLFVGTFFFAYIYRRNCVSHPQLVSKTKVGWLTVKSEYKGMTTPIHNNEGPWGYAVCYAAFVGICALIIFVG
jgi:hypothetical protein